MFEFAEDGKSFALIDETGKRINVMLDEDNKISSMSFPNQRKAVFNWKQATNGYWVNDSIRLGGKNLIQSSLADGNCYAICEDAAYATMAIGVCVASGGLSLPCLTATAVASYKTYNCYRCNNSSIEEPPQN